MCGLYTEGGATLLAGACERKKQQNKLVLHCAFLWKCDKGRSHVLNIYFPQEGCYSRNTAKVGQSTREVVNSEFRR